ncbi:hypothetical protein M2169_002332 [Streptomyces sp. MJP52]|nr:hypothetical protein [Streptomyces sp. MJP52]
MPVGARLPLAVGRGGRAGGPVGPDGEGRGADDTVVPEVQEEAAGARAGRGRGEGDAGAGLRGAVAPLAVTTSDEPDDACRPCSARAAGRGADAIGSTAAPKPWAAADAAAAVKAVVLAPVFVTDPFSAVSPPQ